MIKDDEYLSAAVEQSKKKTTIHYGNDYPQIIIKENPDMEITVTHDRSFQAAMRLKRENSGQKVAVMNFANAFQPGRWRGDRCQCTGGMPLQMLHPLSGVRS